MNIERGQLGVPSEMTLLKMLRFGKGRKVGMIREHNDRFDRSDEVSPCTQCLGDRQHLIFANRVITLSATVRTGIKRYGMLFRFPLLWHQRGLNRIVRCVRFDSGRECIIEVPQNWSRNRDSLEAYEARCLIF